MAIVLGVTSTGLLVAIRVDANGKVSIGELPALPVGTNVIGDIGNVGSVTTLPAISLASNQNVQARGYGWIGGAWQKNPILDGYSGDKTQTVSNLDAAAGSNLLEGDAVPAGEYWRVQSVQARDVNSICTNIDLTPLVNSIGLVLHQQASPGAATWVIWTGEIILSEGDKVRADFSGVTLHDDLYLTYHAVRVDIDQ